MTNVRKRRLYPITTGRRKPKTAFDHQLLAQHNREASAKTFQPSSPVRFSVGGASSNHCESQDTKHSSSEADSLQAMPSSPSSVESEDRGAAYDFWRADGNQSFGAEMQFYLNDDGGSDMYAQMQITVLYFHLFSFVN